MKRPDDQPLFSVIIPTRNRPQLFSVALRSVLDQRFPSFDIIVVNDGSSEEHSSEYQEILEQARDRLTLIQLIHTERGHGQSYALNFGASRARGRYVCFLDDDDQWSDPDHLVRAARVIEASSDPVDLVLANQKAFVNGTPLERVIWIEDLQSRLRGAPDSTGAYTVSVPDLLACQAHCHLNTMIVLRSFYSDVGGMDEGLRYECDRDLYLRTLDRAQLIKFLPNVVSRHNVPDPKAQASMSTAESELSKRLYQLRVFDKAALFSSRPELRHYAMVQRAYVLQHLAAAADQAGLPDSARYYGREALMAKLVWRWMAFTTRFFGWPPRLESGVNEKTQAQSRRIAQSRELT